MKKRIIQFIVMTFIVLVNLLSGTSVAQETTVLDSAKVNEIKAIETTELNTEIQKTARFLTETESWLSQFHHLVLLEKQLNEISATSEVFEKSAASFEIDGLGGRSLNGIRNKWKRLESRTTKVQQELGESQQEIEKRIGRLEGEKLKWERTNLHLKEIQAPTKIIELGDDALVQIRAGLVALHDTMNHAYELVDLCAKNQLNIQNKIEDLNEREGQMLDQLFMRSHVPFFSQKFTSDDSTKTDRWSDFVQYTVKESKEFFGQKQMEITLHMLFALVFFILFILGAHYIKQDEFLDVNGVSHLFSIIKSPFAGSLLVTVFLGFFIYGTLPAFISEIFLLLMLLPFLMLLPKVIASKYKYFVLVFMLAFAMDQLQQMVFTQIMAQRVIILLQSLFLILCLSILLYQNRKLFLNGGKTGIYESLFISGVMVVIVLEIISLYANIIGALSLSNFLNRGVIKSAIISCLVYAIYLIIKGLYSLFLHSKASYFLRSVQNHRQTMYKTGVMLIRLSLLFLIARAVLGQFSLYAIVANIIEEIVNLSVKVGSMEIGMSQVGGFILILAATIYLASTIRFLLEEEILSRFNLELGVPMAIAMMSKYLVLLIGFMLAVSAAGIDLEKFGFIAGALGVGIGFGLQNVVGNFVAGLVLMFERPIRVGDIILMQNLEGTVTDIGIRATKIKSYDGAEVIIPNGDFISQQITNWTLSDKKRRLEQIIEVDSSNDPRKVMDILKSCVVQNENVLIDPSPMVIFQGIRENRHQYRLLFWVTENVLSTRTQVSVSISEKLQEAGMELALPKTEVLIKGAHS